MKEYRKKVYVDSLIPFAEKPYLADDFESFSYRETTGNPADYVGERDTENNRSGNVCWILKTQSAGPAIGECVQTSWKVPNIPTRFLKARADIRFNVAGAMGKMYVILMLTVKLPYEDTVMYFRVRYNSQTGEVEIQKDAATWVGVGFLPILQAFMWGKFEFMVDIITKKILWVELGNSHLATKTAEIYSSAFTAQISELIVQIKNLQNTRSGMLLDKVVARPE